MKYLAITAILFTTACAPTINHAVGLADYEYIGCNQVTNNPSEDGSVAFGPFGLGTWVTADYVFFKQKNEDNTVSKRTAVESCK